MVVKVYIDWRSQPCRALAIFLKYTKIPHEFEYVGVIEGDQHKPEYEAITPLQTVPAIKDGDFCLAETVAIFRYLTTKYADSVPDYWYPTDLEKRARVDEYMAFHHSGTRGSCHSVFICEVYIPMRTGKSASEEIFQYEIEKLKNGLDKLEKAFLKENKYLCGDEMSFADVLAVCEFMQNTVTGRDVTEGRPLLKAFVDRVKERLNPTFDEVHAELYKFRDSYKKEIMAKF